MKKKIILCILVFVFFVTISSIIYVTITSTARLNYVKDYLEIKGYFQPEFKIKVKHSFFNAILGYQQWVVLVGFADELGIIYYYNYDSKTGVSQRGFSGDDSVYGKIEKEELLKKLKHVEC